MRKSNTIVLASTNIDKWTEMRDLLKPYPDLNLVPANEFIHNTSKIGIVEKYDDYAKNSMAKARLVNQGCHYPSLADDSGLEVAGLGNGPGPRSARFGIPRAGMSQGQANLEKVLAELEGKSGDDLKARFVCSLSLVIEGITLQASGVLEGQIVQTAQGSNGFGYDPIFIPSGSNKTLAQMSSDEKNAISHRALALQDLMAQIRSRGITLARP